MNWPTDVKLDDDWQLTQATNGDAPIVNDTEAFLQAVRLEAITQEGDLFYDLEYGWSLLDFIYAAYDETTELEISERVRSRLARYGNIDPTSIVIKVDFREDSFYVQAQFRFYTEEELREINIAVNSVQVEVVENDDRG